MIDKIYFRQSHYSRVSAKWFEHKYKNYCCCRLQIRLQYIVHAIFFNIEVIHFPFTHYILFVHGSTFENHATNGRVNCTWLDNSWTQWNTFIIKKEWKERITYFFCVNIVNVIFSIERRGKDNFSSVFWNLHDHTDQLWFHTKNICIIYILSHSLNVCLLAG